MEEEVKERMDNRMEEVREEFQKMIEEVNKKN